MGVAAGSTRPAATPVPGTCCCPSRAALEQTGRSQQQGVHVLAALPATFQLEICHHLLLPTLFTTLPPLPARHLKCQCSATCGAGGSMPPPPQRCCVGARGCTPAAFVLPLRSWCGLPPAAHGPSLLPSDLASLMCCCLVHVLAPLLHCACSSLPSLLDMNFLCAPHLTHSVLLLC